MGRDMTIGRAARAAGVTPKAIRLYEKRGLLPVAPRTAAGYRLFDADTVDVLRFIRRARTLGLGLDDIAAVLAQRRTDGRPCSTVVGLIPVWKDALATRRPRLGGPLAELSSMMGELLGTARAPIDLIHNDHTSTISVGSSINGTASVMVGPDGQVTDLSHSPMSEMLAYRAEVAKTADYKVALGARDFDLQLTGRAAMRGRFTYRNEQ